MTDTLRYGLLGCGMMGQEHLRNIALLPHAQVTAIVEPDAAMASAALALAPGAALVPDLAQLLQRDDVGVLVITSPNYQHADQLLRIMAACQLPILVEKPICTELADVARLRAAVAQYGAPVWVAMEYRYMPPIARFRQALAEGATGPVQMLSIREHRFPFLPKVGDWNRFNRYTGGTLVEKCCHFFDLMRLLLDDEVVRISASGAADVNHRDELYSGEQPDIIDNAFVLLDFASGQRAMLELCMFAEGSRYQEELCAVGAKGKLECRVPGPGRFWPDRLGDAPVPTVIHSPRRPAGPVEYPVPVDPALLEAGDHNGSTYYQHLGFYQAVVEGATVDVSVDDGLRAVVIGMAAQHAIISGKTVVMTDGGFNFKEA